MAGHVAIIPYIREVTSILLRGIAVLAPLSAAQYAWIVLRRVSTQVDAAAPV